MVNNSETKELLPSPQTYLGLFLTALTTVLFEILLTRILSATIWYHFAFIVLSVAMFGMTIGAILVYKFPRFFTIERTFNHLSIFALLGSLFLSASVIAYLLVFPLMTAIFFIYGSDKSMLHLDLPAAGSILIFFINFAIPFICTGVCTCLALTRFKDQGRLYAADLIGAASACFIAIALLFFIDAPSAVLLASCLSAISGFSFALGSKSSKLRIASIGTASVCAILALANVVGFHSKQPLIGIIAGYGDVAFSHTLFQRWTPMSFVTVRPADEKAWGWGIDPALVTGIKSHHHFVEMDCHAGTPLYEFEGDFNKVDFLKFDVSNLVHSIRPKGDIFVIGIGGGRDILAALMYGHRQIVGAEFNNGTIDVLRHQFADYSGHLDRYPNVLLVNDEARSYLASSGKKFDVIQATLVDTFSASSSGGLGLTENSLYTLDGWKVFLSHLNDDGVLSVTYSGDALAYKMCGMASQALASENPRAHIVIVGVTFKASGYEKPAYTFLVSRKPFTNEELQTIEKTAERIHCSVELSPTVCKDPGFAKMIDDKQRNSFIEGYESNLQIPTDDRPFFYCTSKVSRYLTLTQWQHLIFGMEWMTDPHDSLAILTIALLVVAFLNLLCIVLPTTTPAALKELSLSIPLLVFFSSIGLGFMMIEISQMERLTIFLGHPVYGLAVVLFTLLFFSGIGSFTVSKSDMSKNKGAVRLVLLLAVLTLSCFMSAFITKDSGSPIHVRIIYSAFVLAFPAFFMGMAMPLGLIAAQSSHPSLTPWFWAINGSASVLGSILATMISICAGITATFWVGLICYTLALLSFVLETKQRATAVM